jgi:putative transposase
MSFKGLTTVSLWALVGRLLIPFVCGAYQKQRQGRIEGQADLVCRQGKFYLLCTIELPEDGPIDPTDFLGVDLGIVNIASDSEGETFAGTAMNRNRRRRATARKQHQRTGTKRAKRKLNAMSGRQARFQAKTNHAISKQIVVKAKALGIGIAMEDRSGIRGRVEPTVRKALRRRFGNWSFSQLRTFVVYKAKLAGVPVVFVDPKYTSQTCAACGHRERANRRSQSEFSCKGCGYEANADRNAARKIRAWAKWKLAPKVATLAGGTRVRVRQSDRT